jgi:hypothetical protein
MSGGPAEMMLLGKHDKVFELTQEHRNSPVGPTGMSSGYQFTRIWQSSLSKRRRTSCLLQSCR